MVDLPEAEAKRLVFQSGSAQKLLQQWRERNPKLCRELEREGELYQRLWSRWERMQEQIQQLVHGPAKLNLDQAEEIARAEAQQLP